MCSRCGGCVGAGSEITKARAIAAEALDAAQPGHPARARGVARLAQALEAPEPEPDTVREPIPTEDADIEDRAGRHTPGPWHVSPPTAQHPSQARVSALSGFVQIYDAPLTVETAANARLIAAAPDLLIQAGVLRCLATSPRFQTMTVAEALAELCLNGCGYDNGTAIARATGGAR